MALCLKSDCSCEDLVEKNKLLSDIESYFEELDGHLITKSCEYDDLFLNLFQVHYAILRIRELIVSKLYPKKDKSFLFDIYFLDTKKCLFEAIATWPEIRERQRKHYFFHYGKGFMAANIERKYIWPLNYFERSNYIERERDVFYQCGPLETLFLNNEDRETLHKRLNKTLIELFKCISVYCADRFFLSECFDDIIVHAFKTKVDILHLRVKCIKEYVGGEDAITLCENLAEKTLQIQQTDFRETRFQLR